jgi:hypothetical protein
VAEIRLGPDASRYVLAGQGHRVAKPFHLRFVLPWLCRDVERRWWTVWGLSWPVAAAGLAWWGHAAGFDPWRVAALVVFCLSLPGVWGPHVVRPVGVDLPGLAVAVVAVAALEQGWWPLAVALIFVAAGVKESMPVWAALWAWHPLLLVGLVVPLIRGLIVRPELDAVTRQPVLQRVHDHPVRSAFEHHAGQWRNAWWMVAPWGACLAALYAPTLRVGAAIAAAYAQLLVATDTVRLLHTAAGPAVAFAAVQVFPVEWLTLVCAVHVVWWRKPVLQ